MRRHVHVLVLARNCEARISPPYNVTLKHKFPAVLIGGQRIRQAVSDDGVCFDDDRRKSAIGMRDAHGQVACANHARLARFESCFRPCRARRRGDDRDASGVPRRLDPPLSDVPLRKVMVHAASRVTHGHNVHETLRNLRHAMLKVTVVSCASAKVENIRFTCCSGVTACVARRCDGHRSATPPSAHALGDVARLATIFNFLLRAGQLDARRPLRRKLLAQPLCSCRGRTRPTNDDEV
eukprot:3677631-Pleurochrysis_carterae.AAC.3